MAKRTGSSQRWIDEHEADAYVQAARREGYRSRAAFKLIEIQEKDRIIRPGMAVMDLGAAPGGWSQLAADWVGPGGLVVASDILPMDALPEVAFIQGDFTGEAALAGIRAALGDRRLDLVMSDMAPNISGNKAIDQPRAMLLAELALEFAREHLKPGGDLLVKVFQGEGIEAFRTEIKDLFEQLKTRKPRASRDRSRETYYLARGYRGA